MTGNLALDLLISLAGIVVLVAISWGLGAWRTVDVTEEAAAERLAFDEPDFRPARWLVSSDGRAAAALAGGEIAIVRAVGDGLATRRLARGGTGVEREGLVVTVGLADPSIRTLRLVAADDAEAAEWAELLGGAS